MQSGPLETATYKQVAEALLKEIAEGRIQAGTRMPSVRELASRIGVSPATVGRSYEELERLSYIKAVQRKGAFVSDDISSLVAPLEWDPNIEAGEVEVTLSAYGERLMSTHLTQLSTGLYSPEPQLKDLPVRRWREILNRSAKSTDPIALAHESDPMGYWPLREALAAYLFRNRSVKCSAHQIAVFPQLEAGRDLIMQLLLDPNDSVVVEDPCSSAVVRSFRLCGANLAALPVDNNGIVTAGLGGIEKPIRVVHITPSHHDPTGALLSLSRRQALLDWSFRKGSFIFENDDDSEYSYGAPELPPLKSLDQHDLVIYQYSFLRALNPLVKMSVLVLPRRLVSVVRRAKPSQGEASLLEQCTLASFVSEGDLERHIKRVHAIYNGRRIALIHALTKQFQRLPITCAGTHLLVTFPSQYTASSILSCGLESALAIAGTEDYFHAKPEAKNDFILGFACYSDEAIIHEAVAKFGKSLKQSV